MKKFLIITLVALSSARINAQNETDALRYSLTETPATARSFAMGSSFGALGADLSSFFTNPAGIGMYKRGGVEFSLGLLDQQAKATYMGTSADNSRTKLTLNNIGLVGCQKPENKDWRSFNFGIAYAKTNNFYQNISIKGTSESTLMYPFSVQASGTDPGSVTDAYPYSAGLAYQTYTINPTDTLGTSYEPASTGSVDQSKNILRTGRMTETSFGFGANYRDVLFLGMSVNLVGSYFHEKSTYKESFQADQPISNLSFSEELFSEGTGAGVKVGVVVKPIKWMRIGTAYHTATRIVLRETYSASMTSNESTGATHDYSSDVITTDYTIRTPSRLLVNSAFILGKNGVISADYEYANYERIRMRGTSTNTYDYDAENDVISTIYRSTHKVRLGMEVRMLDGVYLRAGAIYQQSPIINNVGADNNPILTYTGGLGYHSDYWFIDFAMGFTKSNQTYYLYDPTFVKPADIQVSRVNSLLSIGFRY